ncbi:hypothetical protein [Sulfodiicoccus acidiphilus]|uniref:hypothetical protein n=1 Tax=Sulfodiicoccus acidiphilus TaxID=1670455 RepID=UPI000F84E4F8|nr:hypothetical protein [Sulfodiicoccus acidiphilus]
MEIPGVENCDLNGFSTDRKLHALWYSTLDVPPRTLDHQEGVKVRCGRGVVGLSNCSYVIDDEYCHRARKRGIYVYDKPMIRHQVGEGVRPPHNVCGHTLLLLSKLVHLGHRSESARGIRVYNNPVRYYLVVRNKPLFGFKRKRLD